MAWNHCAVSWSSSTCSQNSSTGPCRLYVHGKSTHTEEEACGGFLLEFIWEILVRAHKTMVPVPSTFPLPLPLPCAQPPAPGSPLTLTIRPVCVRVHSNFVRCLLVLLLLLLLLLLVVLVRSAGIRFHS